jgi:hypothetical protein
MCLSDLRLDELMAGELGPDERARADEHLAGCARCGARLLELEGERAAYRPAPLGRPRRAALLAPVLAFAAAAAVLLALRARPAPPGERSKGAPHLGILVSHGGEARAAGPGEVVAPGETLTFTVTAARPGHVAVLGLDGAGQVNVYAVAAVEAGRDRALPSAALLDATPGRERIHAVFCAAPIEVEPLRRALAAGGALSPPAGCSVDVVELEKRR